MRTLPSLKKPYDAKIQEILKGIEDPAEKRLPKNEERTKLHKMTEDEFTKRKERLKAYKEAKNTDEVWKHFAKAVGDGCLKYLEDNKEKREDHYQRPQARESEGREGQG